MTKAPGSRPGPSHASRARGARPGGSAGSLGSGASGSGGSFGRPWATVVVATAGFVVAAIVLLVYPPLRAAWIDAPAPLAAGADLAAGTLPLVAAVIAGCLVGRGGWRALGLGAWRWSDALTGLAIAFAARAASELLSPTTGSLLPSFTEDRAAAVAAAVIAATGAVLVSPVVEELFFRGLALRALAQATTPGLGRRTAATLAVGLTTLAFVALHLVSAGGSVPLALVVGTTAVGLGCGIVTAVTNRLGGAIVAHVAYNVTAVVLLIV